mgnify:CR=1 FL=1
MERKQRNYAALSKVAYLGQADARKINKELSKHGLAHTMEYVPSLSDNNHTTFYNRKTGKAVISYRGTDLGNVKDLFTDTAIFFGVERMTPRFSDALDTAKKAQKMYGKKNVEVTGHSLGGSQALYVTSKTGIPSYAYNPGKTFQQYDLLSRYDSVRDFFCPSCNKINPSNSTVYTTGLDPISYNASRTDASVQYVRPKSLDVHGIDNFILSEEE